VSTPAYSGADLSLRRDLTTVVTVTRERPRHPEAGDHLVVRSILTWDPKQSPTREVDFALVRDALAQLPRRFPGLKTILVDAAAESSSVLPWCRQHPRLSLLVQPFTPGADSNMALWGALMARLQARTLSIPDHPRLIAELRGLRQEGFAFGSKWRVIDASRRFHRDVSFALALAVFAAGAARTCTSPLCEDPQCDGQPPLSLLFTAESREWDRRHPTLAERAAREVAEAAVAAEDADIEVDEPAWLTERLHEMAAVGFSRTTIRNAAREALWFRSRAERIAAHLHEQQEAAERSAQRAARDRAAAQLANDVHRGGGVWMPGD
jgi:hypothetical protein